MEIFTQIESVVDHNTVKPVEDALNTSNTTLKSVDYLKPSTPCNYAKVAIQLLNFTIIFAIILPLILSFLFLITNSNLNIYPFITLFITGAVCQYLSQKHYHLIASILILTGLILTNILIVLPNAQVFNAYYLFLIIPFISAILLYTKNQLHLFFALISICLYLFYDSISLSSSLLFSNPLNSMLLIKGVMALTLSTFAFFTSNYISLYLHNSEANKLHLVSEVALRKSEIKNFSGIAAHDLREPLQTLKGYSNLLKKSLDKKDNLTGAEKDFFTFMDDSTKRMLSLLDDLSIFSTSEVAADEKVAVDLNLVLQAVKNNLLFTISKTSSRVRVGDLPVINGNFNPMLHLFQNIISNGVKYQPKGVEQHIPIININAEVNESYHVIYITDNGIGIPKSKIDCIFEPLKRLHPKSSYKGTGLGLSICKTIIEKYNGKIEVNSIEDEGTTFEVHIPV